MNRLSSLGRAAFDPVGRSGETTLRCFYDAHGEGHALPTLLSPLLTGRESSSVAEMLPAARADRYLPSIQRFQ
jgi:hypothetical protein